MVDGSAGATVDSRFAPPVHIRGKVESIVYGDKDAEVETSILVGSVHVIVTKKRKPYHHEMDFTKLGLHPRQTDIVVVKIGYLEPELYAMIPVLLKMKSVRMDVTTTKRKPARIAPVLRKR